jgi:hypothetical protein
MSKFIEIDGAKFEADDNGKAVVGEDGKPKPYVEPKAEDKKTDEGKNNIDPAKADLTELAKVNPTLAQFMQEAEENRKKLADGDKAKEEAERKALEEKGEWQKVAETEKQKREKIEADLARANELLGKHKTTIEGALKSLLAEIPAERKSLIPDGFTERQQFEYIIKNAELLGVKGALYKKGAPVPQNQDNPQDELEQAEKKFDELVAKKKDRTKAEENEMLDLAKKIKELKEKKADTK